MIEKDFLSMEGASMGSRWSLLLAQEEPLKTLCLVPCARLMRNVGRAIF